MPVTLPNGEVHHVSQRIRLEFPSGNSVPRDEMHLLAYIPWDESTGYSQHIPAPYQEFFAFVRPYLSARTSDVHTALSVAQLPSLLTTTPLPVDAQVVYIALILHDIGWGQMTPREIADSLSYNGLRHSAAALAAKEKHSLLGNQMARKVLARFQFARPLSADQIDLICDIILHHEKPWIFRSKAQDIPLELLVVCDADRLWSYTHENFWQDTVRKDVDPKQYAQSLSAALDGYFFTSQGRARARTLLAERQREVEHYGLYLAALRQAALTPTNEITIG